MVNKAFEAWMEALRGGGARAPREPVARRLAQWLDWTDAIALASALDARGQAVNRPPAVVGRVAAGTSAPRPEASRTLAQGRARMEVQMAQLLQQALADWARDPAPARDAAVLRRAVAQAQRQMEAAVARLRASLRSRLQAGSAAQRELAALDALLEQALSDRQAHLLSSAPGRLTQALGLGENADPDAVQRRLMQALTAELELRLQPLQGLAQALQDTPHPNR